MHIKISLNVNDNDTSMCNSLNFLRIASGLFRCGKAINGL
jgi:hypothetical protein